VSATAIAVLASLAAAVLGYGYWHNATHGSLYVSVLDVSDRERAKSVSEGELSLLDAGGSVLAKVAAPPAYAAFVISAPPPYACHVVERQAPFSVEAQAEWRRCFEGQSRWLVTWIRKVRQADLDVGECRLRRVPVVVSEGDDTWWLWWVPLPHIGGKPYTSFSIHLRLDRARCAVARRNSGRVDGAAMADDERSRYRPLT
jgi:hypothetical protein